MKKTSELIFATIQVPIDYLMLIASFVLAYFFREGSGKPFSTNLSGYDYLNFMLIFLPLWLLIFAAVGLYSMRSFRYRLLDLGKIVAACSAGVMALIVVDFVRPTPIFPAKIIPVYGFLISVALVSMGRIITSTLQRLLALRGIGVYKVLMIGKGNYSSEIIQKLNKSRGRYQLIDIIENDSKISVESIEELKKNNGLDMILVADSNLDEQRAVELMNYCQSKHIIYRYVPSEFSLYKSRVAFARLGKVPVMELRPTSLEGWGRVFKRAFDVIIATILLIITLPFQLIIYIIIKFTDRGPALYFHECFGRGGKKINVYKFRSMKSEYCIGPRFGNKTLDQVLAKLPKDKVEEFKKNAKIIDDPRVSRFGRFIRTTSLDEIPQLYNVLKGDLSLVGPRPIPESELELIGGKENLNKIVMIRPGITGLWQVSGRNEIDYKDRVVLNLYYIENWSLLLDLKILFKTFWQVVFKRNGV